MPFEIKPRQTVLFIGDSITDCKRLSSSPPHGEGYVRLVHEMIDARYPAHQVKVINRGISGNTVRDLMERWTDDAIHFQPDWLSVKIGINDLHTWLRGDPQRSVSPGQYEEIYDRLLARAKAETSARLVLVDPFYISSDVGTGTFRASVLKNLKTYIRIVDGLARKYRAKQIKTHDMFQRMLKHQSADTLCPEPVHPYGSGHMAIAHAWLAAVGW